VQADLKSKLKQMEKDNKALLDKYKSAEVGWDAW
jgi:hypothetical protein